MGIGARFALKHDLFRGGHGGSGTQAPPQVNRGAEHGARPFEIRRRVDAQRHAVHDGHVDAHAGFERPQLLEPLANLQRGGRKGDEAGERRAPIGIKADVMIERPFACRRRRPGEIERAQSSPPNRGTDHLHHIGIEALLLPLDLSGKRPDIDGRIGERRDRGGDVGGRQAWAGRPAH